MSSLIIPASESTTLKAAKKSPRVRKLTEDEEFVNDVVRDCFILDKHTSEVISLRAPKEEFSNIIFRTVLLNECENNIDSAARIKRYFSQDIVFAFNTFFYVHDPVTRDESRRIIPFITYPFQDEAILEINDCIEVGDNLFIDKSREMGATYMVLYTYLYRFLSRKNEHYRIGSSVEDKVDKQGDMGTHFEKLRFNLRLMPLFLLPSTFSLDKHSTYMKLYNPELRNTIVGESTNRNFAAGTRPKSVLFDEFSRWEYDVEAWRSASDATRCKIALSTPLGMGNKFGELSRSEEIKRKLHLMWFLHPLKARTSEEYLKKIKGQLSKDQAKAPFGCFIDTSGKIRSEWYDNEVTRRDKDDVAENLDCNYLTTGRPVFDTVICDRNMRDCEIYHRDDYKTGNLLWKIRPVFDENGTCINQSQLETEFVESTTGIYKMYEPPVIDWDYGYCIGADVAEGLEGGDASDACVIKRFSCDRPHNVMSLHCRIKAHEYGEECAKLAVFYNRAILAIERNNTMGGAAITACLRYYDNLYRKQSLRRGFAEQTEVVGWQTDTGNKGTIIELLSRAISNNEYEDFDSDFWRECLTFMNNNGKLEAQGKSRGQGTLHDDRVMSRAIAFFVSSNSPLPYQRKRISREEQNEQEALKRARAIHRSKTNLVGWVVPKRRIR